VSAIGRYWSKSGHRAARTLNGSVANDAFEITDAVIEDASDWVMDLHGHSDSTEHSWGELSSSAIWLRCCSSGQ